MTVGLSTPDIADLGVVIRALRDWQDEGSPTQLHPGDLGWFWRYGSEAAGAAGSAEHTDRPGDKGLDGVISQDALGLDRIYVQAKRYAAETPVRRPEIQEFVGALHGAQADRGIFVTTSRFTSDAEDYAERVAARLVRSPAERSRT